MVQCKIKDNDSNLVHGGIITDNGDVICLCCGGLIPQDEVGDDKTITILKVYDTWVDLTQYVIDEQKGVIYG